MLSLKAKQEYYKALLNKDSEYEGIFYVGIITTGVFCRPTCSARKPKFENCEFFKTAKEALLASFRPCKRCQPLLYPNQASELIQKLVKTIEANPYKRWKDKDFRELGIDSVTARRQFKKRFNMTFIEYARSRRLGIAMKLIKSGENVINSQVASGYDSSSGFRDAFSKIMGTPPSLTHNVEALKAAWLDTPLGPMLAIANENYLLLLEFVDRRGLEREIERLRTRTKSVIIPGKNIPIKLIEKEIKEYFLGSLQRFTTPIQYLGSPFQRSVWEELLRIPFGQTKSYLDMAKLIGKPQAFRALANANGANQLSIIIPCHRVINNNGNLGGYGGGLARKEWLLNHEKSVICE